MHIQRTSWGWWDEWDDTALQTQDSKFKPWRSEAEHATSRSRRLPTILSFTSGWGRNIFVSFKPPEPGKEPRTLAWKAAVLTTTLWPPPSSSRKAKELLKKQREKKSQTTITTILFYFKFSHKFWPISFMALFLFWMLLRTNMINIHQKQNVSTQQTQTICTAIIQYWTNVEDVCPALYKCYTNVLCLLGSYTEGNINWQNMLSLWIIDIRVFNKTSPNILNQIESHSYDIFDDDTKYIFS